MADHRVIIGRIDEQSVVDAVLSSLRDGMSQALVIRGEPGIGKTTLLGTPSNRHPMPRSPWWPAWSRKPASASPRSTGS